MRHSSNEELATLTSALACCTADNLRQLAALTGEKAPTRKQDLADLIVRHLAGDGLRTAWEGLPDLEQAAVAEVVHSDSLRFNAVRFRAKYGRDPQWGSVHRDGFKQRASSLRFFLYGSAMPADLKARLKAFVPAPRPLRIRTFDQLPANCHPTAQQFQRGSGGGAESAPVPIGVHEREGAAQRELMSLLRLVDTGKVAVSDKTRRASASTLEAMQAILESGDYYPRVRAESKWYDENAGPIRAFAWPLLIQAGGLAQLSGKRLQMTKAGRKALSEPASTTLRTLWNKWMGTTMLDELARIECVKGQQGKGKRSLTAVSSRRHAVAGSLAECPVGSWISTDEFLRHMEASGADCTVTYDPWDLYIGDPQYGALGYEGYESVLNQRYVFALLLEYAATLGIIDVALIPPAGARHDYHEIWGTDDLPFFSRYDGLIYFRVTPLGAWCLEISPDYQPLPADVKAVLQVLPNLEIAASGSGLAQSDRLALNAYAVPVSNFVWRMEAGKLLTAVEEGRPIEEFREFLVARSGMAVPDAVKQFLDEIAERCTSLRDCGLARLIECGDAALATLIANDTRTRKHCLRAGERHLVVPGSSEASFRRGLRDAGYVLAAGAVRARAAKG